MIQRLSTWLTLLSFLLLGIFALFVLDRSVLNRETQCMVANIYHEAEREPRIGKRLVAFSVLTRLHAFPSFPWFICDVVLQKRQYSWTLEPDKTIERALERASAETWAVAREFVAMRRDKPALAKVAVDLGLPLDTYFYKRHDWNEHDPKSKMSEKNRWYWKTCLEPIRDDQGSPRRFGAHVPYRQKVFPCPKWPGPEPVPPPPPKGPAKTK